jgi:hypothetical protein
MKNQKRSFKLTLVKSILGWRIIYFRKLPGGVYFPAHANDLSFLPDVENNGHAIWLYTGKAEIKVSRFKPFHTVIVEAYV